MYWNAHDVKFVNVAFLGAQFSGTKCIRVAVQWSLPPPDFFSSWQNWHSAPIQQQLLILFYPLKAWFLIAITFISVLYFPLLFIWCFSINMGIKGFCFSTLLFEGMKGKEHKYCRRTVRQQCFWQQILEICFIPRLVWLRLFGASPHGQKVVGSTPSRRTRLGCMFDS